MAKPFRLAIAGLGTVGAGVVKIVQKHAEMLEARCGRPVVIVAVSARDASKDRGVDLSGYEWVDHAADLATRDDVDAVIEMIGGSEGLAKDLVEAALTSGKHVVTANKALLAHHGFALAELAEQNGVSLCYEASVAGGIPIIKALREGFAGNQVNSVYGILNGTCNYMLTQMRETGGDFDDILKDAQDAGYAEADPAFDIGGIDAGHKLALLAAIAFGTKPDFESLRIEGIEKINATDISFADEFGYRIKLLGIAQRSEAGLTQSLEPCLVPLANPLGTIEDVYNAVYVDCDAVETALLTGKGAGEGPTASAVMADVVDIARGISVPTFGVPASKLVSPNWAAADDVKARYYLRLSARDQAGVIAEISGVLAANDISIEEISQHGQSEDGGVHVVMTTHETRYGDVAKAYDALIGMDAVMEEPCLMRIEELE